MNTPKTPGRKHLPGRRHVLQLGAAVAAGAVPLSGAPQTPGSGQGGGQGPAAPPDLADVVNVRAQPVEDWTEPYVWRPADWIGQALSLHLVGNAQPPRATGAGNRFTPLFSYNGSSPAPTIRMRGERPHATHTTNLHVHGLHTEPGANPNGTEGDNTFLRVLPRGDWEASDFLSRVSMPSTIARTR